MTAVIPVTGSTYHPRTPTPLTNLIHLRLGETTHREKPLSHDLLAKLVRHITFGKPRRAESATSDRHSRVRQSPFPSRVPLPPAPSGERAPPVSLPHRTRSSSVFSRSLSLSLLLLDSLHSPRPRPGPGPLTPTWFFLLSSEERASPPKRKEKHNKRAHAPHKAPRRGGEGTPRLRRRTLSQTITIPRRHEAPHRGRRLPAEDHEEPSNNRAMRRRPVTRVIPPSLAAPLVPRSLTFSRSFLADTLRQPLLAPVSHVWTRARRLFARKRASTGRPKRCPRAKLQTVSPSFLLSVRR